MKLRTPLFLLAAVVTFLGSRVFSATIDFESFNLQGQDFLAVGSPLHFTNVSGSGVSVTITQGASLRVYDLFRYQGDPSVTGQALIDWPFPGGSNNIGTTFLFDRPLTECSVLAGDFGGDADTPLTLTAYNAGNHVIASNSITWPAGQNPPFALLSVAAQGIRKIVYRSGGIAPGSTFIDSLTFTAFSRFDLLTSIHVSSVDICWPGDTNRIYQVQYSSPLTTNWVNFGSPVPGNGTNCVTDSVGAVERRFYRIVDAE